MHRPHLLNERIELGVRRLDGSRPLLTGFPCHHGDLYDAQLPLSIFSRAALARKADRVRPRAAAASSMAARRPASSDKFALAGRARIEQQRHDRERRTVRDRLCNIGIGAQGLGRPRWQQFLAIGYGVLGPEPDGFDGVAQGLVGRAPARRAPGKIRDSQAVGSGLTVYQRHVSRHVAGSLSQSRQPAVFAITRAKRQQNRRFMRAEAKTRSGPTLEITRCRLGRLRRSRVSGRRFSPACSPTQELSSDTYVPKPSARSEALPASLGGHQ